MILADALGALSALPLWPLFILLLSLVALALRLFDECCFMSRPPEGTEAYAFALREEKLRYLDQLIAEGGQAPGGEDFSRLIRENEHYLEQFPFPADGAPAPAAAPRAAAAPQPQQPQPQRASETDIKASLAAFTTSKFYRKVLGSKQL